MCSFYLVKHRHGDTVRLQTRATRPSACPGDLATHRASRFRRFLFDWNVNRGRTLPTGDGHRYKASIPKISPDRSSSLLVAQIRPRPRGPVPLLLSLFLSPLLVIYIQIYSRVQAARIGAGFKGKRRRRLFSPEGERLREWSRSVHGDEDDDDDGSLAAASS